MAKLLHSAGGGTINRQGRGGIRVVGTICGWVGDLNPWLLRVNHRHVGESFNGGVRAMLGYEKDSQMIRKIKLRGTAGRLGRLKNYGRWEQPQVGLDGLSGVTKFSAGKLTRVKRDKKLGQKKEQSNRPGGWARCNRPWEVFHSMPSYLGYFFPPKRGCVSESGKNKRQKAPWQNQSHISAGRLTSA